MIKFTDYGYSPDNFARLVEASGAKSNTQFMTDNGMTKTTFYRYMRGDTSIDWVAWQSLVKKYDK